MIVNLIFFHYTKNCVSVPNPCDFSEEISINFFKNYNPVLKFLDYVDMIGYPMVDIQGQSLSEYFCYLLYKASPKYTYICSITLKI